MHALVELVEGVSRFVLATGLNLVWQSLLLTLGIAAVVKWGQRLNAATRYAIWAATLVAVVCLPLVGGMLNGILHRSSETETRIYSPNERMKMAHRAVGIARGIPIPRRAPEPMLAEQAPGLFQVQLPTGKWVVLLVGLWGAGALWGMVRLFKSYCYMQRVKRQSVPLASAYQAMLEPWLAASGMQRRVQLCAFGGNTPMAVGLSHPAILFPHKVAEQLEQGQLEQVGLHELAHIRRWDDWSNLVQQIVQAILWFVPAVWYIGRQMELEREVACDDWVVALTGQNRSYALCLARLVELSLWPVEPVLASGAVMKRGHLRRRVQLLLDQRRSTSPYLFKKGLFGLMVLLGIGLVGLSACDNPFAPPHHPGGGEVEKPAAPPATSSDQLMDNLQRAMNDRDKLLYESVIDPRFLFTEFDCLGELVFSNGREEELEIMGTRDGKQGILDRFRTFEFDFTISERRLELGSDHPSAFEGDPNGHSDEDWSVFRGRTQMLMVDDQNDGFRVDQVMTYKMRRGSDGVWRIIHWEGDPLTGDCGAAKQALGSASWMGVKVGSR